MWNWWKGEGKGYFYSVQKGREICGLRCIPDESKNDMRNKRYWIPRERLEESKNWVNKGQNVKPSERFNRKWLEREDGNMCFEMTCTIK